MTDRVEVTLRPATAADASALAHLSTQLGYRTSAGAAAERLDGLLGTDDHAVVVACLPAGEVAGWAHVYLARRVESDSFAELGGFVVDENHRRKGIGKILLADVEEWATERGAQKLRVRTRIERDDALAFYAHWGFHRTKEQSVLDKLLDTRP